MFVPMRPGVTFNGVHPEDVHPVPLAEVIFFFFFFLFLFSLLNTPSFDLAGLSSHRVVNQPSQHILRQMYQRPRVRSAKRRLVWSALKLMTISVTLTDVVLPF